MELSDHRGLLISRFPLLTLFSLAFLKSPGNPQPPQRGATQRLSICGGHAGSHPRQPGFGPYKIT